MPAVTTFLEVAQAEIPRTGAGKTIVLGEEKLALDPSQMEIWRFTQMFLNFGLVYSEQESRSAKTTTTIIVNYKTEAEAKETAEGKGGLQTSHASSEALGVTTHFKEVIEGFAYKQVGAQVETKITVTTVESYLPFTINLLVELEKQDGSLWCQTVPVPIQWDGVKREQQRGVGVVKTFIDLVNPLDIRQNDRLTFRLSASLVQPTASLNNTITPVAPILKEPPEGFPGKVAGPFRFFYQVLDAQQLKEEE